MYAIRSYYATIIGWSYFGEKAIEYIFGCRLTKLYKVIFIGVIYIGANLELTLVWEISDTFNGLMAIPNLIGLFLLSGTVVKITDNYLKRNKKGRTSKTNAILSAFDNEYTVKND